MSLAPRVKASFEGARGALAFGFAAGASVNVRYFQPFDVAGADPTLAKALSETIEGAVLPADVDDLAALPLGAFASVEGDGEVELKGSVELASVINPLATPSLPVIGSASISAGASLNVGAEFRASGGFELRVTKIAGDRVRLSYYKRAGFRDLDRRDGGLRRQRDHSRQRRPQAADGGARRRPEGQPRRARERRAQRRADRGAAAGRGEEHRSIGPGGDRAAVLVGSSRRGALRL